MTTKEDWLFRAFTLREAANRFRDNAMKLLEDARRYDGLAENADRMAQSPQATTTPENSDG